MLNSHGDLQFPEHLTENTAINDLSLLSQELNVFKDKRSSFEKIVCIELEFGVIMILNLEKKSIKN